MNKIAALILIMILPSCIFIAGAAAGAAAAAVVYDHRKFENIIQDQQISREISAKYKTTPDLIHNTRISVSSFNQVVLLTGEVGNKAQRSEAEKIARTTPHVKKVYNQISIRGSSSQLTQASDAWITTKIKTQMLAKKNLTSSTIKVVTEDGYVYLMGTVTQEQADASVNIARRVSGVQRVIKIFNYLDK